MAVQNSSYDHSSYGPGPDDAMTFDASIEQDTSRVRSLLVMVAVIFVAFAVVVWIAYQQGARSAREPGLVLAQQPLKETPAAKPAETPAKSNVDALIENGTARGPAAGSPPPSAAAPANGESVPGLRTYAEDTQAANGGSAASSNGLAPAAEPKSTGAGPLAVESSKLPAATPPVGDTTPSPAAEKATGAAIAAAKTPDAAKPAAAPPTPPQPTAKETAAVPSPKVEVPAPPAAKPPAPAAAKPAESARSALDGKFVLQLGAFRDAEQTAQMWTEIEKRHTDLLSSLKPDTEIANIPGKGTYYRLRVGPFNSDAEAKAICDQLQKRNQPCILRKL